MAYFSLIAYFGVNLINKRKILLKKRDLYILIGNSIDHFDTAIYSFIAPILSIVFFPNKEPVVGLILTYGILVTSIITRPIGTIIFSIIAKKLGPYLALSYSLIGVAITTISIGFIPNYETIGSMAPIMLTIIRMIQGIFAEGECTISRLCILDDKPQSDGLKASYLYQLSTMVGIIVASFTSTIIIANSHQEYWRLAFILGGSCGAIGYYLRKNTTALYIVTKTQDSFSKSIYQLWTNKLTVLRVSIITGFSYMTYVVPFVVMNNFIPDITNISLQTMMNYNTALLILDAAMIPIIGYLIRDYQPKNIMIISSSVLLITIIPSWLFMENGSLWYVNLIRLWIIILGLVFLCPMNYLLNSICNNNDKYLLIGIGNAIGTSIFGRFTPAICIALWHFTSAPLSIALYIAFISFTTIWSLRKM